MHLSEDANHKLLFDFIWKEFKALTVSDITKGLL